MVTWKGENSPVTSKGCKHDFPSVISLLKRLIIYPDITNKGQHVTKDNCVTDQQESKSFNSVTTDQLPSSQLIINANADTIDTFTDPLYPLCLLLVLLTSLFLKASCGKRWYYAWKFLPNSHLPFRPTFYVNCRFLFKKDSGDKYSRQMQGCEFLLTQENDLEASESGSWLRRY